MTEQSMIEQAEKAAQRLEHANKVNEELVKRLEKMEARRLLGGQSEAGTPEVVLSKEEKDKMDMKNYFKGTAIEGALNNDE